MAIKSKKRNNRNRKKKTRTFHKKGGYFRVGEPPQPLNETQKQEWAKWYKILQTCSKSPSETDAKRIEARQQLALLGDEVSIGIIYAEDSDPWFGSIEEAKEYEIPKNYVTLDKRGKIQTCLWNIQRFISEINEKKPITEEIIDVYHPLKSININSPAHNEIFNQYIVIFQNVFYRNISGPKWHINIIGFKGNFIVMQNHRNEINYIDIYGLPLLCILAKSPHLNNKLYVDLFLEVFKLMLYSLALCVYNMGPIAKYIVDRINETVGYKYVIFDCKGGIDTYTCGRGIEIIAFEQKIDDVYTTKYRILVSNTVSNLDDNVDSLYNISIKERIDNGSYPHDKYN